MTEINEQSQSNDDIRKTITIVNRAAPISVISDGYTNTVTFEDKKLRTEAQFEVPRICPIVTTDLTVDENGNVIDQSDIYQVERSTYVMEVKGVLNRCADCILCKGLTKDIIPLRDRKKSKEDK